MVTSTSSGCFHKEDCRPWEIEIHAGLSEADPLSALQQDILHRLELGTALYRQLEMHNIGNG